MMNVTTICIDVAWSKGHCYIYAEPSGLRLYKYFYINMEILEGKPEVNR